MIAANYKPNRFKFLRPKVRLEFIKDKTLLIGLFFRL